MTSIAPFLLFCGPQQGKAEEALRFYESVLPDARVASIDHWAAGDPEPEGTVRLGVLEFAGQRLMVMDSAGPHEFTFTPGISLFVEVDGPEDVDAIGSQLEHGGQFLMPPANYDFSRRFAWVADRYGVSWQLNAP